MKTILSKLSDLNGSFYVDSENGITIAIGVAIAATVLAIAFLF